MVCFLHLRRRVVLVGITLWICSLLAAYSFLAQEPDFNSADYRQMVGLDAIDYANENIRKNHVLERTNRHENMRLPLVKLTNHNPGGIQPRFNERTPSRHHSYLARIIRMSNDTVKHDQKDKTQKPNVSRYCNRHSVQETAEEGAAYAGTKLLSVHVITRHGDTSPLYNFPGHPNPKLTCQFDLEKIKDDPQLSAYITTMRGWENRPKDNSDFESWALYPGRKVCGTSQLTPKGARQMLDLGFLLHERYIQRWGLLGFNFGPQEIKVRSTQYTRSYQSSVAFLYAFLPKFNLTQIKIGRVSSVFFCNERSLEAPCTCPLLRTLKKKADTIATAILRNATDYKALLNSIMRVYGLTKQSLPMLWPMMDSFLVYECNYLPLPCNDGQCVTHKMVSKLWNHLSIYVNTLVGLEKYRQYSSLALHPFLSEMVDDMEKAIKGKQYSKFNLFSGHDKTLLPLYAILGTGGTAWPQYASRTVLELYSRKNHSGGFLRVLQDGRDVTSSVSFCKHHSSGGMCPLKRFVAFVRTHNLGQFKENDYINFCYNPS